MSRNHPSASDSNPGTWALPWRTIYHAFEVAAAGDSVLVFGGIYTDALVTRHHGDTLAGPVVFAAYPGEAVIVDGTANPMSTGIRIEHDHIRLYGFEVRNWPVTGIWVYGSAGFRISECNVHDVVFGIGISGNSRDFTVDNTVVHHFDLYGIDASPMGDAYCHHGRFVNCVAHTGRDPEQNVDGFALGHGVQHNFLFQQCQAYGVYDGFDISASSVTIDRCRSENCANACYKLWEDGVELINSVGYDGAMSVVQVCWSGHPTVTTIRNCTFHGTEVYNIWMQNSSSTLRMYNTIISGGDNIGLCFEQPSAANYEGNFNLFQNNNASRTINVGWQEEFSTADIDNGLWTDYSGDDGNSTTAASVSEIYADPYAGDLHLKTSSPAVNHASPVWAPEEDYDGQARPYSTGPDMGAYELPLGGYHVSGNVSGTWLMRDTIIVDGDLIIPVGDSLVVQPAAGGTDIIFNGPWSITIFGRLCLNGTAADSIRLFPADTATGWHGLRFFYTSTNGQDSSTIRFCRFSGAVKLDRDSGTGGAIYARESSPICIRNSIFERNEAISGGAAGLEYSRPLMSDIVFTGNEAVSGGALCIKGDPAPVPSGLLHANDLQYLGAFRLPDVATTSTWGYSGSASAFRPDGDPDGMNDGFPGSVFAVGHDWYLDIGEISIPAPVISPTKNPEDLPVAITLQPLTDVSNGFFDTVTYEMIRTGLAYLPPQGAQSTGKVYMCAGQHYQFDLYYSHIWCEPTLDDPMTAGPWYFGNFGNYRTNDYMFNISEGFASEFLGGKKLISGRYRDGGWSGKGPNMYAFAPWSEGNPPAPLAHLQNITHLLGYTDTDSLNGYKHADEWIGGAWMESDSFAAVAILGTKALGDCWYGFANGVTFPNDSNYFPPWPYDIRGWWADDFEARILFYDPSDLAAVAAGTLMPWQPQPYDSLSIEHLLYNPGHDFGRDQLGSCCYDPAHGLLYVFERLADGDKSIVHVFRVQPGGDRVMSSVSTIMERLDFSGNVASHSGGAVYIENHDVTMRNVRITGNHAGLEGGGLSVEGVLPVTLNNFLVTGNTAGRGAGISLRCTGDLPELINFTVAGNSAMTGGGAVFCDSASPALRNCILWGNLAGSSGNEVFLDNPASDPVFKYCDIQGGLGSFGGNGAGGQYNSGQSGFNIDLDPQFVTPGINYRLTNTSPCANSGDPANNATDLPAADLDGLPRVVSAIVDMGCYEFQQTAAFLWLPDYPATGGPLCLAAAQTITLAGNGNLFIASAGANLHLEAGHSILALPGTIIMNGAYARFRIITDGIFCGNPTPIPASDAADASLTPVAAPDEIPASGPSISVWPNPSDGIIHIRPGGQPPAGEIGVHLYNLLGQPISSPVSRNGNIWTADLSGQKPGVYLLHVQGREFRYCHRIILVE